jgi:chemotaxis protein MotA
MMLEGIISILEGMNPRMIETKLRTFIFEARPGADKAEAAKPAEAAA